MITPSQALEALLFAAGDPLTKKQAAALLDLSPAELAETVTSLTTQLGGRGLSLVETDTHLELRTSPEVSLVVKKLRENELSRDLGKAGLETLAIVLYQNGSTRGTIDWIRGVNSSQTLRTLLLRGLVERVEDPGDKRKFRYRVTTEALAHLGVSSVAELPRFEELAGAVQEAVFAETAEDV